MPRRSVHLCGQALDAPGHICAFFDSREEEYGTLIPFLREGLDADENVVTIVDASALETHRARLAAGGLPVNDQRLTLETAENTYLANGRFQMTMMLAALRDALSRARAERRPLRAVGRLSPED